jgi:TldD protein
LSRCLLKTLDPEVGRKVLTEVLAEGGAFADLYSEATYATSVVCEEDRIEKVIAGLDTGVGLRVLFDGRTFYGHTNGTSFEELSALAGRIRRSIREERGGAAQDRCSLSRTGGLSPAGSSPLIPVGSDPGGVPVAEKVSLLKRANGTAWKLDPRVRQVRVIYRDVTRAVSILNSEGLFREGSRTGVLLAVQVVTGRDGEIQTGYEPLAGTVGLELFEQTPPEEVAERAGRRSLLMLDAGRAPVGPMTVVLSAEAGGTMIHEAVGHGLEGDLARQGLSVYSGKVGEQVASALVTVVDDPTLPGKWGSYPFDDEGTPSRRTVLVEKGILKGYLYDRLNAMKDGAVSTGNGRRESYHARPIPRMSNTMILPGAAGAEAVIRSVDRGLLVRKMGGGQVNTVNGDFVFEVSEGYLIERGEVGPAVRGAMLTGNGPRVLRDIDRVADDLGFGTGSCGKDGQSVPVSDAQPTLRIPELLVGGRPSK